MKLILVSKSPRRLGLLRQIGIEPVIYPSINEESKFARGDVSTITMVLAQKKVMDVMNNIDEKSVFLSADTLIEKNGRILGKPKDIKEAKAFLKLLNNSSHRVITSIFLLKKPENESFSATSKTTVYFKNLSDGDIDAYLKTKESLGKAGAYAIQERGAFLVRKIEGCYFNVVGLPIPELVEGLNALGAPIWKFWKQNDELYD